MKLKIIVVAAATALVIAPTASAKERPGLSKDEARQASIAHVYSSGSCRTRDWGTCDGVTAPSCKRSGSQAVSCVAEWGGVYTDPVTGEATGTWSCEQTLGWRATATRPKLSQTTGSNCT